MTVLGKFAATDAVFIGVCALLLVIFTFPDRHWQSIVGGYINRLCLVMAGLIFIEIFFALLTIWGVH